MIETKLEAHVVEIEPVSSSWRDRYRWRCSCGEAGNPCAQSRSARTGGQRHVAAMERGR